MKPWLIFFLILGFQNASLADDNCSTLLLDSPGGAFEHIPVLDQGETDLCQYYTVAQMIDAYRFTHGDHDYNFHTSPMYIWMNQNSRMNTQTHEFETDLDYDSAISAIARSGGVCEINQFEESTGFSPDKSFFDAEAKCKTQNGFKSLSVPAASEEDYFLDDIPIAGGWDNFKKENAFELDDAINDVQSSLLAGQAVAVAYQSCVYSKKGILSDGCTPDSPIDHMSIIIGRRADPRTHKCQFRIRNSWGKSCFELKYLGATGLQCDHGNFWIDVDELKSVAAAYWTLY